jgi:hypothetical protein
MTAHDDAIPEILDEEEIAATEEDIKNIIRELQENPPKDGHALAILLRKYAIPCDERVLAARKTKHDRSSNFS